MDPLHLPVLPASAIVQGLDLLVEDNPPPLTDCKVAGRTMLGALWATILYSQAGRSLDSTIALVFLTIPSDQSLAVQHTGAPRSEERRVGTEGGSTGAE